MSEDNPVYFSSGDLVVVKTRHSRPGIIVAVRGTEARVVIDSGSPKGRFRNLPISSSPGGNIHLATVDDAIQFAEEYRSLIAFAG